MFDHTSCVSDAVGQLFDVLAVDNDMLTLTEVHALISKQLFVGHHRNVREEEDHHGDDDDDHGDDDGHGHDEEQGIQNVNLQYS